VTDSFNLTSIWILSTTDSTYSHHTTQLTLVCKLIHGEQILDKMKIIVISYRISRIFSLDPLLSGHRTPGSDEPQKQKTLVGLAKERHLQASFTYNLQLSSQSNIMKLQTRSLHLQSPNESPAFSDPSFFEHSASCCSKDRITPAHRVQRIIQMQLKTIGCNITVFK